MEKRDLIEGQAVVSRMGHDTNKKFVVLSVVNEDFVLIADGKNRTIAKPKLKRKKHLKPIFDAKNSILSLKQLNDAKIIKFLKNF